MSDTSTEAVERLADGIEATLTKRLNLGPGVKSMESDTLRALAAERDVLKAEAHEARMQSIVDFGKLQKACEERDALRDALDDANSYIAFLEAQLEAYEEMAPPRDPDLLRKRLDEIKAMKEKRDD